MIDVQPPESPPNPGRSTGRLYVYFTYGMHHCANVVTDRDGLAGAVLLRAIAVEAGSDIVRLRRRPRTIAPLTGAALLRGPGNLCRGLALDLRDNGMDIRAPGSRLVIGHGPGGRVPLVAGPRVGIRQAIDSPLRFAWAGHPAVSTPMPPGR